MFAIHIDDHKLRQAELVREAEKFRLILALRENKSHAKNIARKIQGLISIILP